MHARPSREPDSDGIRQVHVSAFGRNNEADLVERLDAEISLVAEIDGAIVGHVALSRVTIDDADTGALGLGPIAVDPHYQRRGLGSELMREAIGASTARGFRAIVLLGDPHFYTRFGFRRALDYDLGNQYGADMAFQVLSLTGDWRFPRGLVRYSPAFEKSES